MAKEYDRITAFHYAAYRPALHLGILKDCLAENGAYSLGLDVGCGTGQSSIALAGFCENVIGIEPSREMLERSIPKPNVEYYHYDGYHFDFPNDYFDIITFAGSLYYTKSQFLLDEVIRVSQKSTEVIIYDFELILDPILEKLNNSISQPASYDHEVNFQGLNQTGLLVKNKFNTSLSIPITAPNISHLLLSVKDIFDMLLNTFGKEHLYKQLSQEIQTLYSNDPILVQANTYSTVYQVIK